MILEQVILSFLNASSEVLAAAIVVLAASMLLYNLTRDLHNRIARTSGLVLACVTIPYIVDVFVALEPELYIIEIAVRLQWLGIAFIPAALFHLSDALLATTGLPSRGRRKRIVRILYGISAIFLVAALFSNAIIVPMRGQTTVSIEAGAWAWLYIAFFISLMITTFINVQRARQRSLTRNNQRRMTYLQIAILTPAFGIFPYSLFLNETNEFSLPVTLVIIVANIVVVLMLIFLSYPLSFFGSDKPDRIVKTELLHFLLRGPGTGLLALTTIIFTSRATDILGLSGREFLPFAVVAVVLMYQWTIALGMPYLERLFIYRNQDDDELPHLQALSERILTRYDLLQVAEANLAACCDYLRVKNAFILAIKPNQTLELVQSISGNGLLDTLQAQDKGIIPLVNEDGFQTWDKYQIIALRSTRDSEARLLGVFGIEANANALAEAEAPVLENFVKRANQTLEDLTIQSEIFASLEGLLPQISTTRSRADDMEYRPTTLTEQTDLEEIYEQVRAALRHYWGGPGIARSRLLDWKIAKDALIQADTPTQALRQVLTQAIEKQRPSGERSFVAPEWTIYNILQLRFIEGKRVRDVAKRMALSEADLFRKQRLAIETISQTLIELEAEVSTP